MNRRFEAVKFGVMYSEQERPNIKVKKIMVVEINNEDPMEEELYKEKQEMGIMKKN